MRSHGLTHKSATSMTIDIHCSDFIFFFIHQCNVVKQNKFLSLYYYAIVMISWYFYTVVFKYKLVVDISVSICERNMAVGGLQAVRDALTFAYAKNVIDDVEFALLYDYNRSKPILEVWRVWCGNLQGWRGVSHGVTFWQRWFAIVDKMFTNPGANSLPARYCLQWNGEIMYPLEKIRLPLQVQRYGTSVWRKSVWAVSHFQQSYGHHLRDSPPSSWKLVPAFSFPRSTSQLWPSRTSMWYFSSKLFWVCGWDCAQDSSTKVQPESNV